MEKIKELFKNKKFLIIFCVLALILLIALSLTSAKNKTLSPEIPAGDQANYVTPSQANQSVELQKAIEDQKKADAEYSNWQEDLNTNYPWLKKLPLYSSKYFVYFEVNKKVFVGKLYPKVTDNINDMKTEIVRLLKVEKEIPVEKFQIEWTVIPR